MVFHFNTESPGIHRLYPMRRQVGRQPSVADFSSATLYSYLLSNFAFETDDNSSYFFVAEFRLKIPVNRDLSCELSGISEDKSLHRLELS